MNEQDKAVDEYLASIEVTFSAVGGHKTKRDDWECFAWLTTFKKQRVNETFDYYCGLAHVKPSKFERDSALYVERPQPPSAACVLYSLLSDAEAYALPFHEWCGNYGYDSDSIKALNIYQACSAAGLRLARVFTQEQREHLQQLLQDY